MAARRVPSGEVSVYDAALLSPDAAQVDKILQVLGLTVPSRELRHADGLVRLRSLMSAWLPLGDNALRPPTG